MYVYLQYTPSFSPCMLQLTQVRHSWRSVQQPGPLRQQSTACTQAALVQHIVTGQTLLMLCSV